MPARVVRGEINASESLSRVSVEAELVFRALITAVDDYGRMDARHKVLKGELFPLRDGFTPSKIEKCLRELEAEGCVQLYEVDGRPYLWLTGWERHRGNGRRGKESRWPKPPAIELSPASEKSAEIREIPGDPSENRESGIGNRGTGSERDASAPRSRSSSVRGPEPFDPKSPQALSEETTAALAGVHGHDPEAVRRWWAFTWPLVCEANRTRAPAKRYRDPQLVARSWWRIAVQRGEDAPFVAQVRAIREAARKAELAQSVEATLAAAARDSPVRLVRDVPEDELPVEALS